MTLDWMTIIAVGMIIGSLIVFTIIYYELKYRECINNPFTFGSKQIKESTGYEVAGSLTLLTNQNAPIVYFNSENVTISYRNLNPKTTGLNLSNFSIIP